MIDTGNKGNLIQLMIQMGRGPIDLEGQTFSIDLFPIYSNEYLETEKSFVDMTDAEIVEDMKRLAGNTNDVERRISSTELVHLDPATAYIYDIPDYVEMLIPILRADGQVRVLFFIEFH